MKTARCAHEVFRTKKRSDVVSDPKNLPPQNPNNSTQDPRVIWEDGLWAIIEAGDSPNGLARSKTRDNLKEVMTANWDPAMTVAPGPASIAAKKLVKVRLVDLLATPQAKQVNTAAIPTARAFEAQGQIAPPSPFIPKPWKTKDIPAFPHQCRACGGRYYLGLSKSVPEATENGPLAGA